jgi:hypothetical protein
MPHEDGVWIEVCRWQRVGDKRSREKDSKYQSIKVALGLWRSRKSEKVTAAPACALYILSSSLTHKPSRAKYGPLPNTQLRGLCVTNAPLRAFFWRRRGPGFGHGLDVSCRNLNYSSQHLSRHGWLRFTREARESPAAYELSGCLSTPAARGRIQSQVCWLWPLLFPLDYFHAIWIVFFSWVFLKGGASICELTNSKYLQPWVLRSA